MTNEEAHTQIANRILELHRSNLKILARLKALETMVIKNVPASEREAWYKSLDEQMNRILQEFLEHAENQSPSFGAMLDDRKPDELEGL